MRPHVCFRNQLFCCEYCAHCGNSPSFRAWDWQHFFATHELQQFAMLPSKTFLPLSSTFSKIPPRGIYQGGGDRLCVSRMENNNIWEISRRFSPPPPPPRPAPVNCCLPRMPDRNTSSYPPPSPPRRGRGGLIPIEPRVSV